MWLFLVLDNIFMIPVLIMAGIFLFASGPVLLALIHDIKSDRPAFINGVYMMIGFMINAVAVMLIGIFADLVGFEITYKLSAILAFGAVPFVLMIPNDKIKLI